MNRFFFPMFVSCLMLTSVLVPYAAAQNEPDEEIEVDSSIVILNAVVTDKSGNTLQGLSIADFLLLEDNIEQALDFVEAETTPFAAVILLDVSGSMEMRVSLARSAAIQFLNGIRPGDSVAIYSFDSKVELVQEFSNSRDMHPRAFDLEADGNTALNDAVYKAAEVLSVRPEKRRAIIVLSDGADTRSRKSANKALKAAQAANATIYTVDMSDMGTPALSRRQSQSALKNFSKKTGGLFVKTPGGIELRSAFSNIVEELGILYTIGYHPKNGKRDGKWRKIVLSAGPPGTSIRTREGYYAAEGK